MNNPQTLDFRNIDPTLYGKMIAKGDPAEIINEALALLLENKKTCIDCKARLDITAFNGLAMCPKCAYSNQQGQPMRNYAIMRTFELHKK